MGENRYMDAVTQGVYILGVKDAAFRGLPGGGGKCGYGERHVPV